MTLILCFQMEHWLHIENIRISALEVWRVKEQMKIRKFRLQNEAHGLQMGIEDCYSMVLF